MEQAAPLLPNPNEQSPPEYSIVLASDSSRPQSRLQRYQSSWERFRAEYLCLATLLTILPRYIQPGGRKAFSTGSKTPTAYLDAVRGYAAFFVFLYHGWQPTSWVQKLPIIRVFFYGGAGMVALFFIISGYVLSYRMLMLMHKKQSSRLLDAISSSTFRRWLRLYGSTAMATLFASFWVYSGWFNPHDGLQQATVLGQLWNWFLDALVTSDPFANLDGWMHPGLFYTRYLAQMWTIPLEYRGSIALFVFCAASAKMSVRGRMIFLWVVVLVCYFWRAVYVAEFLMGMFIAELSFIRYPERLGGPRLPTSEVLEEKLSARTKFWKIWRAVTSTIGSCIALVIGLLLLSQPDPGRTETVFPHQYLVWLVPNWYGEAYYTFWLSWGAFLVILALDSCPMLQTPFKWSFSQYIGDLSFGLYAMHIIFIQGLYRPVFLPWQATHLGDSYLAYTLPVILITIIVICFADYFTRVDKCVVRFARWLQTRTFTKWE
ncbi:hypothetical protein B0A52_03269 [Exophiala mesophila]|uniref:Acyltransferase 3 domain-containing protein n=1 Tax=Exophiala mesophila TaxID=212818 RepID=A0A438NBC5_EXOME|nr:hypothetical protein B0A52_03269 [Exophiala mesophila]